MPKDYKNINQSKAKTTPKTNKGLFPFFTGLSIGLVIAIVIYVRDYSITDIDLFQGSGNQSDKLASSNSSSTPDESVPEPTFDFYTVLPNREINISEYIAEDDDEVVTIDGEDEHIFIFQVGSFEDFSSADQVKARLALIGIDSEIQRVVINGQDSRHRVRVGPFKEPIEINEIRKRLYSNNLEFMLLKLRLDESLE